MKTPLSRYQYVSILDFIEAKDDGGGDDNWSDKTCKTPVMNKLTPSNLQVGYPSYRPTLNICILIHILRVANEIPSHGYVTTEILRYYDTLNIR